MNKKDWKRVKKESVYITAAQQLTINQEQDALKKQGIEAMVEENPLHDIEMYWRHIRHDYRPAFLLHLLSEYSFLHSLLPSPEQQRGFSS